MVIRVVTQVTVVIRRWQSAGIEVCMKSLKIVDVKSFMSKLLIQNVFDAFLVSEVTIHTFQRFEMNGKLNRDYYSAEELETLGGRTHAKWGEVRPFAYQIVKGNKTPLSFQISLMLSQKAIDSVLTNQGVLMDSNEVTGLYFHLRYENNELHVVTGTGVKTFTLDKTLDYAWDEQAMKYLKNNEIAYEE